MDKEKVQRNLEDGLNKIKLEIEQLKIQADKAHADLKSEYHDTLDELQEIKKKADHKLHDLKSSTEKSFENAKLEAEKLHNDLSHKIKQATERFRNK